MGHLPMKRQLCFSDDRGIPSSVAIFGCSVSLCPHHWDLACPAQLACPDLMWLSCGEEDLLESTSVTTSLGLPNASPWPWFQILPPNSPLITCLAKGAITGASSGARSAGAKPPVCTILWFCFKDTFLSATLRSFWRYLVNLAFSAGVRVTFPLRMFSAYSERHWMRSLSAPCNITLHTWGWALAKARRRGACRYTRDVILMCTPGWFNLKW